MQREPGAQNPRMERLGDEIGGARIERGGLGLARRVARDEHHRYRDVEVRIGFVAPPVGAGDAAEQRGIGEHQVGHALVQRGVDQAREIGHDLDLGVAHLLDHQAHAVGVVIEHQNPRQRILFADTMQHVVGHQ